MHRADLLLAWEKKAEPGHCSPGFGQRGVVARPLDGGTLTHWGARTPARGLATMPRLWPYTIFARSVAVAALRGEESGERESEEREAGRSECG